MSQKLGWGILGTGNIARQFAAGIAESRRGRLLAVASRSADASRAFAAACGAPTAHHGYETLLDDPAVDAVYISLPNTLHHAWTMRALRAGKHVLCEKPFAATRAEAEEMFDEARRTGRLLVEAFMYRSHPQTLEVQHAVARGDIGRVRLIRSSFCYRTRRIEGNIRFDPKLAGGALMDVGCYCISLSRLIAGEEPTDLFATGHLHQTGVDDASAGVLRFPSGIIASFTCGMSVQADNTASICGEEGYIEVPVPWKPPATGATYTVGHSTPPKQDLARGAQAPPRQSFTVDAQISVFALEADDFARSVQDAAPPRVTERDTVGNMAVLDEMRRQIGLRY